MVKRLRMELRCGISSSPNLEVFPPSVGVSQADGVGLAGAIIKLTQDGPGIEQPVARGVTVYYIVDSLELVSSSTRLMKKC